MPHLLSILIWLPIGAGLAVLALGDRTHRHRPLAVARGRARDTRAHRATVESFRYHHRGTAVRREAAVDPAFRGVLRARRRRHLAAAHRAHRLHDRAGGDRRLDRDRGAPVAVLRRLPHHGRTHDRRVLGERCAAVLLFLGSDADPDVPHHRHLGRSAARVRHHQVLPVHLPRLGVHAGRAHLYVREGRRLLDRDPAGHAAHAGGTALDLPRLPARLRRQGTHVPGAHLAPGRARRGAHRRLGDPRRHHAEDGWLRLPALLACPSPRMPAASSICW